MLSWSVQLYVHKQQGFFSEQQLARASAKIGGCSMTWVVCFWWLHILRACSITSSLVEWVRYNLQQSEQEIDIRQVNLVVVSYSFCIPVHKGSKVAAFVTSIGAPRYSSSKPEGKQTVWLSHRRRFLWNHRNFTIAVVSRGSYCLLGRVSEL